MGLVLDDACIIALPVHDYRIDGQSHGEETIILAFAFFIPPDSDDFGRATVMIILEVLIMLYPMMIGHEHAHILTDHLLALIFKELGCGLIDHLDLPSLVNHNDAINGCFKDSLENGWI